MSRRAQIEIATLRFTVQDLLNAAFAASPEAGGSPAVARVRIVADEASIDADVAQITGSMPPASLNGVGKSLLSVYPVVQGIYEIGAYGGGYNGPRSSEVNVLQASAANEVNRIDGHLLIAANVYDERANAAKDSATFGALATIASLLLAFGFFYSSHGGRP